MTKGGFSQLTGKVRKLHTGNSSQKKKTEVIFSCIEKKVAIQHSSIGIHCLQLYRS